MRFHTLNGFGWELLGRRGTALLVAAAALGASLGFAPPSPSAAPAAPSFEGHDRFDDVRSLKDLRALERDIVEVTERVRPSVVLLRTIGFGGASGTAVIISPDGLLATCGHVGRSPGHPVTAMLPDGTKLEGKTLGQAFDSRLDCGLVQLDTGGRTLPAVPLGTTEDLAAGDWVVALGYTHGQPEIIRPSLARVGRVLGLEEHELYIDAPIDAGDSGGPTFNLRGEVIGLNSRCGPQSWQNVATPIDRLVERMDELKAKTDAEEGERRGRGRRMGRVAYPAVEATYGKLAVERDAGLRNATRNAESSLVRLSVDGTPIANGIVVDRQGLAVTKASQLAPDTTLTLETQGGARFLARQIARDAASDVALVRFDPGRPIAEPRGARRGTGLGVAAGGASGAGIGISRGAARDRASRAEAAAARPRPSFAPVTWSSDATVTPGEVILSPRGFGETPALGFAAIESRETESDAVDGPYLGVQTRPANEDELERADADRAVVVERVLPNTPASRAGLAPGDIVLAVNGESVGDPTELRRLLRRHKPGDAVELSVVVPDGHATKSATLGTRGESDDNVRRGNTATPISRRSSGLGALLAHDAVTRPEEMGGPIVDDQGRVIGMNIARYDRTSTHAVSAARMAEITARLVASVRAGNESPATDAPETPDTSGTRVR
ncbi:MAG: trypsin-like peptidase domain-containing protein [Phycisphaerae bacterium]|nr:trypsin-like peptidase domain-containing protein [Phycisphaerae bacterium]